MTSVVFSSQRLRVVILGGGFGGAYAAQSLCSSNCDEIEILLIDRNNYILFYPLLVEAGVGLIEGRHVVVPIRSFIRRGSFLMAEVLAVDLDRKQVTYQIGGEDVQRVVQYDHLVFALGSVTKLPPIPGLVEYGFVLKSLTDALEIRDRGIRLLELANTLEDPAQRNDILRFIVVGANYSGVELAGEYEQFIRTVARSYPRIDPHSIDIKLIEYGDRILSATTQELSEYAHKNLVARGVDIRTQCSLSHIGPDHVITTDGERFGTGTVVWTAGIAPHPIISSIGLPVNQSGYIECEKNLRVKGHSDVWAVGDSASVPDPNGFPYAPTAQNASRQGPVVAKNLVASIKGDPLEDYVFNPLGAIAGFGRYQAVASLFGRNVKGRLAWLLYRTTYLMKMPTLGRKVRLGADWFLDFLLPSPPVQLGIGKQRRQAGRPIVNDKADAITDEL